MASDRIAKEYMSQFAFRTIFDNHAQYNLFANETICPNHLICDHNFSILHQLDKGSFVCLGIWSSM